MDPKALLGRFLELANGSTAYFVSGSFSFLPRLEHYRQPEHDLDVAVDAKLFGRIQQHLHPGETVHVLSLSEVALADASICARLFSPRTSFVHVTTASGLLDFAYYAGTPLALNFTLGPGLRLTLPPSVLDRVETITWQGVSYRAAPIELAFIPKAIAYSRRPDTLQSHHVEDLRRLAPLVDLSFVIELARFRGLRLLGRRLPRLVDPFDSLPDLARRIADAAA
jgi:hypothetical protein